MYRQISVSEPYFSLIRSGFKTVEGKKNKTPWNQLEPGEIVKIVCDGASTPLMRVNACLDIPALVASNAKIMPLEDFFYAEVVKLTTYSKGIVNGLDPLDRFLQGEGLSRVLPHITNWEQARQVYLSFSTIEEIMEHGMLAIRLSVGK